MAKPILLEGVIDRLENGLAVIKTKEGQEVCWPAAKLPAELKAGSPVVLSLLSQQAKEQKRQALAKELLNEILNVSGSSKTN